MPTGVELGAGSRVVLMPDRGGVGEALAKRLAKLGVEVLTIDGTPEAEELERQIEAGGPTGRSTASTGCRRSTTRAARGARPGGLARGLRVRVKLLAATMRALAEQVAATGTFLVAATRLGGRHGYDAGGRDLGAWAAP